MKLVDFWKPEEKDKPIVVERTDKTFLKGVHKGEPIWKVSRGNSYMLIRQEEANEWNKLLQDYPHLTEDHSQ
ncbi:MAG: hypothetical protein GWN01_01465 [Nitrosopumilaceae archaeon]|nr:hypothetical protein [Nitrosopumilaceae archaeon]NIU86027.1 hypothetical protein [Nitrosopumilaceae archaeon]NIX60246.1 hypothetical protein [Nitrosopumilaceae archaeon]